MDVKQGAAALTPAKLRSTSQNAIAKPSSSTSLLSTVELTDLLGISYRQLRPILDQHRIEPTVNQQLWNGRRYYLWDRHAVGRIRRTNLYKQAYDRNACARKRQEAAKLLRDLDKEKASQLEKQHAAILENTYRDDLQMLLLDAACCMQSLNRMVKNRGRMQSERERIYALKNRLIRMLSETGFSIGVEIHEQVLPQRACNDCWERCACGFERSRRVVKLALFKFRLEARILDGINLAIRLIGCRSSDKLPQLSTVSLSKNLQS